MIATMALFDTAPLHKNYQPAARFPLEPVLRRFDLETHGERMEVLAEAAGVSLRTVYRWEEKGLDYGHADLVACRALGVHPHDVWCDWDDAA